MEDSKKQPILQWKTKKRVRQPRQDRAQNVLQSEETTAIHGKNGDYRHPDDNASGPLVIPVAPDRNKWKPQHLQKPNESDHANSKVKDSNDDDTDAIQALHDDAVQNDGITKTATSSNHLTTTTTIVSHANTFVTGGDKNPLENREVQQYQNDMNTLPSALEETAEEYQRVPISEFGAALLRGMGWKDDEDTNKSPNPKDDVMPRPHRLGLGAIPAVMLPVEQTNGVEGDGRHDNNNKRPRSVAQYQRDQRTQQQHDMYRIEREKKIADDRQRTLQDGSIVHLVVVHPDTKSSTTKKRARILKLVGVPGLNMVQVKMEYTGASIILKRNEIDRLVTREELDHDPFREATSTVEAKQKLSDHTKSNEQQFKSEVATTPNVHQERIYSRSEKKRNRNDNREEKSSISWVIPNIRVRIVTEKLGRRYYKEKGVVVDVTHSAGVTLKLNHHHHNSSSSNTTNTPAVVLDRIPERYLETALPKVGGSVIVVNPKHENKYAKGRLIERDSKDKNYGIVQLYEDMDCIRLPLDDIAEWCGPLDDDEI